MKPSLRNQYFRWLLLLLCLSYLLLIAALSSIELHEAHEQHSPFRQEVPEIAAFATMMLLTIPLVILAAWHIAGRLLRPLSQVLSTAERIRQGNLEERIPPLPHADELSRLADTINDAFDRYSAAVQRLERFSADASHQLRTPLAAIRSTAEVALQSDRPPEAYREAIGDLLEQAGRLNETIEQLLRLSRLDRSMRDSFAPLPLRALLAEWVEEMQPTFEDARLVAALDEETATHRIRGNEVLVRELLVNLVDNARAFTPAGGTVRVSLRAVAADRLELRVEDSGPGIPAAERDRVFDRFFRGAGSRHAGSGLGLAIVREIALLHQGSIRAEASGDLGGAAMVVEWPSVPGPVG